MVKQLKKKTDVTRKIRDFFREGGSTSNHPKVKEFVSSFQEEYAISPELLAFLLQKINSFQLFKTFKDNKSKQVYPKITLIDVVSFCKRHYGYDDIYNTINNRLLAKMNTPQEKAATMSEFYALSKAASRNENIKNILEEDKRMASLSKFASSKLHYKFKGLIENYWSLNGIEKFIKSARLDTDITLKEVLDDLRNSKITTWTKEASLSTFLEFEKTLKEFINDNNSTK